jgi:glycosyltransferase involved in cell wall biosynthesis
MVAHFSIDVDAWCPPEGHDSKDETTIRILHAPNHRHIKGTQHFINAVQQLKAEGLDIELVILQRVPNHEVREVMASVDIVADQLVVGWYAMFALEAMAMKKPVLCYIREDIENLYIVTGLLEAGELPIVKCTPLTVREVIRHLALNRELLPGIGERSREYVLKHHSTEAVGRVFAQINAEIGLLPSSPPKP